MSAPTLHVFYLPWANLDQEIAVGPVRFIPFADWIGTVSDPQVVRYWKRYARCHIGQDGRSVQRIAIAVHAKAAFGSFTPRQEQEVVRASYALSFAFLAGGYLAKVKPSHRRSGSVPIAGPDRFVLYRKQFRPDLDVTALTSGGVHSSWNLRTFRWQHPAHVMGGMCVGPDRDLLVALGGLITAGPRHPFAGRIWATLEHIRFAFSGAEMVQDWSRLAMMMTAFDTLLDTGSAGSGGGGVKRAFSAHITDHLLVPGVRTRTRDFGKYGKQRIPWPTDWFYEVYDLRGKLVHANKERLRRGKYPEHPHLLLAVVFAWAVIRSLLVQAKKWPLRNPQLRKRMAFICAEGWTTSDHRRMEFTYDLRKLYRDLGWLRPGYEIPRLRKSAKRNSGSASV